MKVFLYLLMQYHACNKHDHENIDLPYKWVFFGSTADAKFEFEIQSSIANSTASILKI